MIKRTLPFLAVLHFALGLVTPLAAAEVEIGLPRAVMPSTVVTPDEEVSIWGIATSGHDFGALLYSGEDMWFSRISKDGSDVDTIHLAATEIRAFLPGQTWGTLFWTGSEYLALWRIGPDLVSAVIASDGMVRTENILRFEEQPGRSITASAWNPSIDRGIIYWDGTDDESSGWALIGGDGSLLETFDVDFRRNPIRISAAQESFVAISSVHGPDRSHFGIERFRVTGTIIALATLPPTEGHRYGLDIIGCGDEIMVMELGRHSGHSAQNVLRYEPDGELLSFATLHESPDEVPYWSNFVRCDGDRFEILSGLYDGTRLFEAFENGLIADVSSYEGPDGYWVPHAAVGDSESILIAERTLLLRRGDAPDQLLEITPLRSAEDQFPVRAFRSGGREILLLTDSLLIREDAHHRSLPLPEGREFDLAVDGKTGLLVWSTPSARDETGIRAAFVDFEQPKIKASFVVSEGDDYSPSAVEHVNGFAVIWERNIPVWGMWQAEILGRIITEAAPQKSSETMILEAPERSGYFDPLVRPWGSGYLLLASEGSKCSKALCAAQTPYDLLATRLDDTLHPLWTVEAATTALDEIPADAACEGETCFVAWTIRRPLNDPCIILDWDLSIGSALIHEQGSIASSHVIDIEGVNETDPVVGETNGFWFIGFTTEIRPGCPAGEDTDLRGAFFSPWGSPLMIGGGDSFLISGGDHDEVRPTLLENYDGLRLFYASATPDHGTGAARRLLERTIQVHVDTRRTIRQR